MSEDFKIDHDGGGTTVGRKIRAKNGAYWRVQFFQTPPVADFETAMNDKEVEKLLRHYGYGEPDIKRILERQ